MLSRLDTVSPVTVNLKVVWKDEGLLVGTLEFIPSLFLPNPWLCNFLEVLKC